MFKKLKVTHRLVLLVCGVAVPLIGATLYATMQGVNKDIRFALAEKQGLAYQRPLAALLAAVPSHQILAAAVARGDQAARSPLLEKEVEIDQLLADLETVHDQSGRALGFTDDTANSGSTVALTPRALKAEWQKVKTSTQTPDASDPATDASAAAHSALSATIQGMLRYAGDTAHLTTDPDLDTAHLRDVTTIALPDTQIRIGAIANYGNTLLRRDPASLTAKDLTPFSHAAALLAQAGVTEVSSSLEKAQAADAASYGLSPTLQKNLAAPLQTYTTAQQELMGQLNQLATPGAAAGVATADALVTAAQNAQAAGLRLWKASADELTVLLQQRVSSLRKARWLTLGGVVGALALALGVAYWVARGIIGPLAGLTQATTRILRGESNVRAPVYGEDEIGELATTFNALLQTRNKAQATVEGENKQLQSNIQELLAVVSEASDGKLGVRARVSEGALGNVCDALNLMLENVGGIISNAKSASDQVAAASTGISNVAQELEKGEARQTQEIFTTSEGVRDLNGKAQKVLENCQAATKAAANGRQAAEQGAKAVREVIKGMEKIRENTQANAKKIKRLGDRSMEISGIVKVIGDISAKTDMLALNASIEAARAGEQGRGFTVVAEQVRSLADRTKTLTNQIEKLVADIQKETGEAVAQMETQTQEVEAGARAATSAGGTLENIVTVSNESSELVSQINQSASQQAERTQEMMATVENINQVVTEAAVKVRETRSTSEQLMALSAELNKRLAQFETVENSVNSVVYEQPTA